MCIYLHFRLYTNIRMIVWIEVLKIRITQGIKGITQGNRD